MLRGRHRGLPVAIDRAVMLPYEFKEGLQDGYGHQTDEFGEYSMSRYSDEYSSDTTSEESSDGRSTTHSPPPGVGSQQEKADPAPPSPPARGRDIAPRRRVVHADTVRSLEERTNDVVDEQLRSGAFMK